MKENFNNSAAAGVTDKAAATPAAASLIRIDMNGLPPFGLEEHSPDKKSEAARGRPTPMIINGRSRASSRAHGWRWRWRRQRSTPVLAECQKVARFATVQLWVREPCSSAAPFACLKRAVDLFTAPHLAVFVIAGKPAMTAWIGFPKTVEFHNDRVLSSRGGGCNRISELMRHLLVQNRTGRYNGR